MNIRELHEKYVNIVRFQEIVYKVAKYGFSDLLDLLRIDVVALGFARKVGLVSRDYSLETRPVRFRMLLEELGPTFVKLGQILSTREELLPPEYVEELSRLQEHVAPEQSEEIKRILFGFYDIEDESDLFLEFDYEPIAAASISQVHQARLKDGKKVILKIQRPRIRDTIQKDITVLTYIVGLIEQQFGDPKGCASWSQFVHEFIQDVIHELDFVREGILMDRFRGMFSSKDKIYIPEVYQELSGKTILVQECIEGARVSELPDFVLKHGISLSSLGETLVKSFFHQVFAEGIFHGDPHPGNLRFREDGSIVLLDFGMVGQIDPEHMSQLVRIFWGAGKGDYSLVARSVMKVCTGSILGDTSSMVMDIRDLVEIYRKRSMASICIKDFMNSLDEILRQNNLKLPAQFSLLLKAMITLEQVADALSPNLKIMDFLLPEINNMVRSRFTGSSLKKKAQQDAVLFYDYFSEIPRDLFWIIKNLKKMQEEASTFREKKVEEYFVTFEKTLHRGILGLLIAALLLGSSILLAFNRDSDMFIYVLGVTGYLVAAFFAFMLIYNIISTRRKNSR